MSLVVVDASIIVLRFLPLDPRHEAVTDRLSAGDAFFAPALLDLEVASSLRNLARTHEQLRATGSQLIQAVAQAPIRREPVTTDLLLRAWDLRHNLTVYDAVYVALAERLGATLLLADVKAGSAPGIRCPVEVI